MGPCAPLTWQPDVAHPPCETFAVIDAELGQALAETVTGKTKDVDV